MVTGRSALLTDSDYNREMKQWSSEVQRLAKQAASLHVKGKKKSSRTYKSGPKRGKTERKLKNHIQYSLKTDAGEVTGIGFGFERHGIFLEYGVSRSHGVNAVRRSMSDWLSGTLEKKEKGLVDIVAEYQGDKVIKTYMGIKK